MESRALLRTSRRANRDDSGIMKRTRVQHANLVGRHDAGTTDLTTGIRRYEVFARCTGIAIGWARGTTHDEQGNRHVMDIPSALSRGLPCANSVSRFINHHLQSWGGASNRIWSDTQIGPLSWTALLWPACQQSLAQLLCRYSRNTARCEAVTRVTANVRSAPVPGQLLFALGLAADAHQMTKAITKSVRTGTMRPAAAQATRSLTTWGAVWAGAELFGTGGAILGLEVGPGAVVTSGIGAMIGGVVGLFASEWLARRIDRRADAGPGS